MNVYKASKQREDGRNVYCRPKTGERVRGEPTKEMTEGIRITDLKRVTGYEASKQEDGRNTYNRHKTGERVQSE